MNPKQIKWAVLGVVAVLATVVGVLAFTKKPGTDAAGNLVYQTVTVTPTASDIYAKPTESVVTVTTTPSSTPDPTTAVAETSPPPSVDPATQTPGPDGRLPTNIPMTKLAPGEEPPQFIIFSFDGVGSSQKMHTFLDAAAASNARFVGFLTGTYLLTDGNADAYQAPGAKQGSSQVGFGGDAAEVIQRVNDLNQAYLAGNEIGTHYNGHFCELGRNWSTADWNSELDQFYNFFTNWKTINGLSDAPDLVIPASEVKGGRTPCLAHQWDQIEPAWLSHNMIYDSSQDAPTSGIFWPRQVDGVWEFYMPQVYSAGLGGMVTGMDYNFWYKWNKAKDDGSAATLTPIVLDTYRYMYDSAYNGNRAPVLIANHFNNWNGNAFNPATEQFMRETCIKPNTYCATYLDVIAWMELQDPAVLQSLQDRAGVAVGG